MSEQRPEDSVQPSGNPRVLIVNMGEEKTIPCNYDNAFVIHFSMNKSLGINFLNRKVAMIGKSYDYILYISDEFNFRDENSLSEIIEEFNKEELKIANALYFDLAHRVEDKCLPIKFYPTMSDSLYYKKYILQIPFIVRSNDIPNFSDRISGLHLWDGILNIFFNKKVVFHVPKQKFIIENAFGNQNRNISEDIAVLNELYQ